MANALAAIDVHALGAELGAGSSIGADMEEGRSAAFVSLRVTVAAAALSVQLQTSHDNANGWRSVGIPLNASANTAIASRFPYDQLDRYIRATWPAGTDATFAVSAVPHQLYAQRDDIYAKLAKEICQKAETKEPGIVARGLITASCYVQDALANVFPLPMTAVSETIVDATAAIAALIVLERNGFVGADIETVVITADARARKMLETAARTRAPLVGAAPAHTSTSWVRTNEDREW